MKHACVTLSISIAVIAVVLVLFGYLYVIPQPQHNAASTPATAVAATSPTPQTSTPQPSGRPSPTVRSTPYPTPKAQGVKIVWVSWEKGGFGVASIIHLKLKNLTDQTIGNIRYSTTYVSDTGIQSESLNGDKVITKLIKPGQTRTLEVNDGLIQAARADKMDFRILDYDFFP
jgi:hypothetical protein